MTSSPLFSLIVAVFATVALVWIALDMLLTFDWHESYRHSTSPLWVPPVYRDRCQRTRQPRTRFAGQPHHADLLRAQWTPTAAVIDLPVLPFGGLWDADVRLPVGATFGQPVGSAA
jgi:hypothetical protein